MAIRPTATITLATTGTFTVELVVNMRLATIPTEARTMTMNMP